MREGGHGRQRKSGQDESESRSSPGVANLVVQTYSLEKERRDGPQNEVPRRGTAARPWEVTAACPARAPLLAPRPGRRGLRGGAEHSAHQVRLREAAGPSRARRPDRCPGRARTASESSRAEGLLQRRARPQARRTRTRAHAQDPQPARTPPVGGRRRAGPGGPKTNKLWPRRRGAPAARARRGGHLGRGRRRLPPPPSSPAAGGAFQASAAGRRGVISGRAEGGDETGPRRQAWRCCSGGRGRKAAAGATASGGSAPGRSRLKAGPSPRVAGTAAAPTRPARTPGRDLRLREKKPRLSSGKQMRTLPPPPAGTPSPARPGTRGWKLRLCAPSPSLRSSP